MQDVANILANADDESLAKLINQARQRLVVVAPALRSSVAKAVAERWQALGPANVTVMLDANPEAFRVGLGDLHALDLLDETARRLGAVLRRKPGLWIGIVVSDNRSLVFSPIPPVLAVEKSATRANGLFLDRAVVEPLPYAPEGQAEAVIADADRINRASIEKVKEDLANNPPQPVAAAEKIRVFNAFFEFVELELAGTAIERKTVPIPADLLGLANSDDLRERMRASFRLVADEDSAKLSGRHLDNLKRQIMAEYLIALKDYGKVVLRSVKPDFERKLAELRDKVDTFKQNVEKFLEEAITRNRKQLVDVLLPAVKKNLPNHWKRFGAELDDDTIGHLLEGELRKAFGTASHLVGEMKVKCVFKGVTYELLANADFMSLAEQAIPNFPKLHREFDAVEIAQAGGPGRRTGGAGALG